MDAEKYWANKDGKDYGPYTKTELLSYLRKGLFSSEDSVCKVGEANWTNIEKLFPPPPPPPPSPPSALARSRPQKKTFYVPPKDEGKLISCAYCGELIARSYITQCPKCGGKTKGLGFWGEHRHHLRRNLPVLVILGPIGIVFLIALLLGMIESCGS